MHDVEDKAAVVGHIDPPVLVLPNLPGMISEQFADELRNFDARCGLVVTFDV